MDGINETPEFFYRPYGEEGTGYYSRHTPYMRILCDELQPIVLGEIDKVRFNSSEGRPFTICDFGTSDGGTAVKLLSKTIDRIRQLHGDATEVYILHEDQPVNDFKSLMLLINGLLPGLSTYLKDRSNVYFSAVGVSFYEQCCPSESLHMAISSTALHYLSGRPCSLTEAVHHTHATVPEEKAKFAAQAVKDWETILLHRAKEMVPGGRMIFALPAIDEKGRHVGFTCGDTKSMYKVVRDLLRQMVNKDQITEAEFMNILFYHYYRTVDELTQPFTDTSSTVYKAGLRMRSCETRIIPCTFHQEWMAEGKKGDVQAMRAHAQYYVLKLRSWMNSQLFVGLSEHRPIGEREAIIDQFFQMFEDDVALNPALHELGNVEAFLIIEKLDTE